MKKNSKKILPFIAAFGVIALVTFVNAAWTDPKTICENSGLPCRSAEDVLLTVLNYALAILTLLGVIGFITSGVLYITSGGVPDRADKARLVLTNSIIGIVVGLLGYIVVSTIDGLLRGTILPVD